MSRAVKKHVGTGQASINRRVNHFILQPSTAVKQDIRNEVSKEIQKLSPKSCIKRGPSHTELVRRAEHMIYSGMKL